LITQYTKRKQTKQK